MLDSIINWCSHNITYTNIRNIAELFYFIVLTGAMVYYAAKSYEKSVEAKPEIISHIYIDYKDRLERGQSCYPLYLEIYNNGTGAAKNLKITTDNVQLTEKFSIFSNNLGFIQPGNSKYVPIGSLNMTMGPNYLSVFDGVLKQEELDKTSFFIEYDNHKKEKIDMILTTL